MNELSLKIKEISQENSRKFDFYLKICLILYSFHAAYYLIIDLCVVYFLKVPFNWFTNSLWVNFTQLFIIFAMYYLKKSYFKTIEKVPFKEDVNLKILTQKIQINIKSKYIIALCLITSIIYFLTALSTILTDYYFSLIGIFSIIFSAIIHFTFRTVLLLLILSLVIHIFSFPHKIRKISDIDIYHSDHCGGLLPVGNYNLKFIYIYFLLASLTLFSTSLMGVWEELQIFLFALIFIIVGLLLFIIPQISLSLFLNKFKTDFIKNNPLNSYNQKIDANFEDINYLIRMRYDFSRVGQLLLLRNFPIDLKIFFKLLFTASLPLIVLLFSYFPI